jgi:hypothetical protein
MIVKETSLQLKEYKQIQWLAFGGQLTYPRTSLFPDAAAVRRRMARRPRAKLLKARFPRLRQLRQEQLGWEIVDIVSRLPGAKPSISSIYRLEQGDAIRMSSARRVFDVVNGALHNSLDAAKELEASW